MWTASTGPMVTYFVPVRPGQRRSYGNVGTCCGGTGMENHTKYQDSIYFQAADESALYVNLYIPSTLTWAEKKLHDHAGDELSVRGRSTLTVNGTGPLDIKLRVPSWVRKGFVVRVNGTAQRLDAKPGTYVTLSRTWRTGDRIEIAMPFTFRAERAIDNPAVQSIFYGPTLLAVQHDAVGQNLETGLIKLSFYKHVKLDGDLAPAMTPGTAPLHVHDGRLHAGAVLRRRSVGRRRVAHDGAVSRVRAAGRAADRVRVDRLWRAQPRARGRADVPRRALERRAVREPQAVHDVGQPHCCGLAAIGQVQRC